MQKKEMNFECLILNILMMEFLNCVLYKGIIFPELYFSSMQVRESLLQMALLKNNRKPLQEKFSLQKQEEKIFIVWKIGGEKL